MMPWYPEMLPSLAKSSLKVNRRRLRLLEYRDDVNVTFSLLFRHRDIAWKIKASERGNARLLSLHKM